MGKVYTEDQIKKLNDEEVQKLFNNYEAKLSGQMVKSLGHSIITMYSMGACAMLAINNQDALSEDLENDPFLNSALQRFTCELYYRFGSFLVPLSIGLITSRHYLSECNKNGGTSGTSGDEQKLINLEKSACGAPPPGGAQAPGAYEVIGAALAAELMIGFWFGIGVILAVKMVQSLEYCIEELISRK